MFAKNDQVVSSIVRWCTIQFRPIRDVLPIDAFIYKETLITMIAMVCNKCSIVFAIYSISSCSRCDVP